MSIGLQKDQWQPTTWEDTLRAVAEIEDCLLKSKNPVTCYVYGMGGGTKKLYKEIGEIDGNEVVLTRSTISGWMRFMRPIIANMEGLVRITSPVSLTRSFNILGACGTVTILVCDKVRESAVLEYVKTFRGWEALQTILENKEALMVQSFILDDSLSSSGVLKKNWSRVRSGEIGDR